MKKVKKSTKASYDSPLSICRQDARRRYPTSFTTNSSHISKHNLQSADSTAAIFFLELGRAPPLFIYDSTNQRKKYNSLTKPIIIIRTSGRVFRYYSSLYSTSFRRAAGYTLHPLTREFGKQITILSYYNSRQKSRQ